MTRARSLSQLANSSVFTVATNNRVGIGSEVPTAKLDVDGTLNVSGNATIGGVATYEDVTNVDSVGIVTARSGVSVPDGQKIQLGNSNDLQIYHTGSHSLIDEAGTGNLVIRSNLISFEKYTNEQLARFTADGSCELFHDNSKKLETTSTGVSITGAGTFSSSITAQNTILANRTGSTQTAFQATLSGVTKVNIQAGGSANFASHLITGSANSVTSTSAHGSYIGEGIVVNAIQPNATLAAQERVWLGKLANVTKSQIFKDGSATFAGTVKSGALDLSNTSAAGIEVRSTGEILLQRPSSQGTSSIFDGRLGNTQNVNILGNGSASFGQASNSTNNNGILLGANVGQLNLYTTRYNTDCFQILNTSGSGTNVAVRFDGDGTATFAGSVSATVGSFSGNVTSARTSSSHTCFNGTLNGTTTSNILANGNATFDGGITSKQEVYVLGTTTSTQRYLNFADAGTSNYRATLRRDAWYLGAPVTNIGDVTPSGANIVLNMSGSATFANKIVVGTQVAGNNYSVQDLGKVMAYRSATNGGAVWNGGGGSTTTSTINADGSVSFAARFSPGTTSLNDHAIVATNNNAGNGVIVAQNMNNSGPLFQGYNGSSVKTVDIFSDGNAIFRGKLDVGQLYGAAEIARFGKTASGATSYLAFHTANANYAFIGSGNQLISNAGASDFGIRAEGHMIFSTGGNIERMRIDSSGNVGINHSSPQFGLTIGQSANDIGKIGWEDSGSQKRASITCSSSTDALQFHTGTSDTERMRITSGGVMQMGDPSSSGSGGVSLFTSDPGTNHQRGRQLMYAKSTTSASQEIFQIFLGSTNKLLMRADGNLYNAAGGIGTLSDAKLKENIVDATSQWNDIKSLRIRKYNFKEETGHDTHTQIGLVAQEVETVSPGLVYDQPDKDENGNDLGTVTKVVNTSVFYMKTAKALQEAMARIETLEAEVAALKAS